jgi:hypothetical protein
LVGPSGNLQGGYKLMALNTGKKITWRSWDVIPMPDTVIACLSECIGNRQTRTTNFYQLTWMPNRRCWNPRSDGFWRRRQWQC